MFQKLIIVLTLSISLFSVSTLASESHHITTYQDAWLEEGGTYPIIHLKGTESEMGEQFGFLAGHIVDANIKSLKAVGEKNVGSFVKYIPNAVFTWLRRTVGRVYWTTFSNDVKTHINGIVTGANQRTDHIQLNRYDIAFVNSLIDIAGISNALAEKFSKKPSAAQFVRFLGIPLITANCDSFAAWGPRTVDGKTFQTRNTDIDTGDGIENYPLVMIVKKEGKIPYAAANIAGVVGIIAGMNADGVGLGQVWAKSKEIKLHTPWHLQMRETFMNSHTAREAVANYSKMGKAGYGSNFVFADAGDGKGGTTSEGFSIEVNAKQLAVFDANDQRELELKVNGETVGLPLPYAVLRGDLTLDPALRANETAGNGPNGDPRPSGSYQERYLGQYQRIVAYEQKGELIGSAQAIAISKETAMKNANLLNAVYANSDRDMWVSYSKINADGTTTQAFEREYMNVPFYKYLSTLVFNAQTNQLTVVSNYSKQKQNFKVKVSRGNRLVGEFKPLNLNQKFENGDEVELIDEQSGELLDRLVIKGII